MRGRILLLVLLTVAGVVLAQGRGRRRWWATAQNEYFATSDGCTVCHSVSDFATAWRSKTGQDVSPHHLWRGTMMGQAFLDPYWRAQVARESAAAGDGAKSVEQFCMTCHAPMTHHTGRLSGVKIESVREAERLSLARDGVGCTVCHQARADNLSKPESFSGNLDIRPGKTIYGPYARPFFRPMRGFTGFTATQGGHIRDAGLCGSCHTLITRHAGHDFPEQTPYLEWLNSDFAGKRSCAECHMPEVGTMRIARNPGGRDFPVPPRPGVRAHAFVGGNTFMLRLMREHSNELGIAAPDEALERMERATRAQLAGGSTAALSVSPLVKKGVTLHFEVRIANRTGHKLPTGYPARRMWLRVRVTAGPDVVFQSGDYDEEGRIKLLGKDRPHLDVVALPGQVPIFDAIPADARGVATTMLTRMAGYIKDNRILPAGWRKDGPYADRTKPRGIGADRDFVAGSDTVHYRIRVPADEQRRLRVDAWLYYQSVPPDWVEPLRKLDLAEAKRFVRMYDASGPLPETLATAARDEAR